MQTSPRWLLCVCESDKVHFAGLGLELVKKIFEESKTSKVAACCRDPDAAQDLQELQATQSSRMCITQLDLSVEESVSVRLFPATRHCLVEAWCSSLYSP